MTIFAPMLFARFLLLPVLLLSWLDTALNDSSLGLVSRRNRTRKQAVVAYRAGRYAEAQQLYQYLIETNPTPTLAERINLGQALFQQQQYKAAKRELLQGGANPIPNLMALAATQLGLLACLEKDTAAALEQFRRALLNDPESTAARQNFELLKLHFSGKKPPRKSPQTAPQQRTQQAMQGQRVEQTEQQQETLNSFRNSSMSEQQARQLLDALQADDLPYELARRRTRTTTQKQEETGRW
jgi:tetratricopeptide (TPR) repeat protein